MELCAVLRRINIDIILFSSSTSSCSSSCSEDEPIAAVSGAIAGINGTVLRGTEEGEDMIVLEKDGHRGYRIAMNALKCQL